MLEQRTYLSTGKGQCCTKIKIGIGRIAVDPQIPDGRTQRRCHQEEAENHKTVAHHCSIEMGKIRRNKSNGLRNNSDQRFDK